MTEHCVNNDRSRCQTKDATHLILLYNKFRANTTIGHTYSGERADLAFHLAADPEAPVYRLKLFVANHTHRTWNVLLYEDPHNHTSAASITTLPAKTELQLYTLREYNFSTEKDVLVFFRFGDNLFDIEQEELQRLWMCLNKLQQQPVFADMTVSNEAGGTMPAHRAILAAATQELHNIVASLETAELEEKPDASSSTEKNGEDGTVAGPSDISSLGLEVAFEDFANNVIKIKEPDDETTLIENLKKAIEVALEIKIPANKTTDIALQQPNPNRHKLAINGLRSRKDFEVFLRYVYTGKFDMTPKVLDDDHVEFIRKLDDMLAVIHLFDMTGLVSIIEAILQTLLKEHTAVDLLQMANQYDLGKLKFQVVQYLRRPTYKHILMGITDPMFYNCVISNPCHRSQSQFYSKFAMSLGKKYTFYLCGLQYNMKICDFNQSLSLIFNFDFNLEPTLPINTLEFTLISKNHAEKQTVKREVFLLPSTLVIMSWDDFADDESYYEYSGNIITCCSLVEVFIEANTELI